MIKVTDNTNSSVLTSLHTFLALFCLFLWIVIEFNQRIGNSYEISESICLLAYRLTCVSAFLNLLFWIVKRNYLNIVLSIVFLLITYKVRQSVGEPYPYNYVLICMAIANLRVRTCLVCTLSLISILVAYAFFANLTEISKDTLIGFRNDGFRYSFGLGHPNAAGSTLLFLSVCLWTLFKSRISHIAFLVINAFLFCFLVKYVDSRTAEICLSIASVFIILTLIYASVKQRLLLAGKEGGIVKLNKVLFIALVLVFPFLAIAVFTLSYLFDWQNEFLAKLNILLSSRLSLSSSAINHFGLSLFGSNVISTDIDPTGGDATTTTGYYVIDSLYIYIAVKWGLLTLLLYVISNFLVVSKSLLNGNYRIAVALAVLSFHAVNEVHYSLLSLNILIYLMFVDFSENLRQVSLMPLIKVLVSIIVLAFRKGAVLCKILLSAFVSVMRVIYAIAFYKFVEVEPSCSALRLDIDQAAFEKKHKYALLAFIALLAIVGFIFFADIVNYFKTVSSILGLSDFYNRNLLSAIFVALTVVLALFVKSLFFAIFYKVFKGGISLKFTKSFKYVLLLSSIVIIAFGVLSEITLRKEINNRSCDIQVATKIVNELNQSNADYNLYVDKVPTVYRRADFNVNSKEVFFDSVFLDDKPNVVFADPNDEHKILLKNGYKFAKLSDTLSLYVKDQSLVNVIQKSGISLSNSYTCQKSLNLKRIAYINKVKYRKGNLYLPNKEHPINRIDNLDLTKGKYRFTLNYHFDENKTEIKDGKIFKFILTSNDGLVNLIDQEVIIDSNVKGERSVSFELSLDDNKHSVNMQILSYIMTNLYFSKISYEKYE